MEKDAYEETMDQKFARFLDEENEMRFFYPHIDSLLHEKKDNKND